MKIFLVLLLQLSLQAKPIIAPKECYHKDYRHYFEHLKTFYPYINEAAFKEIADHVLDSDNLIFDPESVEDGDTIYVGVWLLEWFIENIHDALPPYVLITCDVDSWLPKPSHAKLIYDPKVIAWFAKNMLFTNHPKLFQLPMGHLIFMWQDSFEEGFENFKELVKNTPLQKKHLLYMNHTERDHGRRVEIADYFYNKPFCFSRNRSDNPRIKPSEFWKEIAESKFVLSPLGLEVDCVRTWECFALQAIPIVEHSYLDPLYKDLPILLIHQWEEITESFLEKKYEEFQSRTFCHEKGLMGYWECFIIEKQNGYRKNNKSSSYIESTNFTLEQIKTIKRVLELNGKKEAPIFYEGSLTNLRPFQIAAQLSSVPYVFLSDLWVYMGYKYLREFTLDSELLKTNKIKMLKTKRLLSEKSRKKPIAYFLDLTHFRHSLLKDIEELRDFQSSLEVNIKDILNDLKKGDLLFGNQFTDKFVHDVLSRLNTKKLIAIKTIGDFWYAEK